FMLHSFCHPLNLHSFPTRRSSDLYIVSINAIPNDPSFPSLVGFNNTGQTGFPVDADIDAPEAWDITTGSNDVVVAVIDTGVDYKDRKSTRLNSSHEWISYAVFCLK